MSADRTALHIAADFTLPLDSATQTFAVLAKRRVGKTYTASVIAEEMVAARLPFVVLDPTGAWWGLRASADGTAAGLPVVIIGGPHGDVPLEPTAGKVIADLVVDHPGFYVLDLKLFASNGEQDRFATDFAERLYRRKAASPSPLHLFVDECDSFIPQSPMPGQQRMLGAYEALVRRGGISGIGVTLISQRPAIVNKNVLTQCEVLIALQIIGPQDRAAIDAWVKGNGTEQQRAEIMASLAKLGRGEAWVWSPAWLDVFRRIRVRERRTFNSSATPAVGEVRVEPRVLAPVDLDALRTQVAESIEKAKADDPKELRARIVELEREAKAARAGAAAPDPALVEHAVERAAARATQEAELRHEHQLREVEARLAPVVADLRAAADTVDRALAMLRPRAEGERGAAAPTASAVRVDEPSAPAPRRAVATAVAHAPSTAGVSRPQQRMLVALAQFAALGIDRVAKSHVAVFSDQSPRSSGFEKNMSTLRSAGLIDYPAAGVLALTPAGKRAAGRVEAPATLDELHAAWYAKVSGPQDRMLKQLIAAYPRAMARERLAERTDQSPRSSGWEKNLSTLRSLGLIDYPDRDSAIATELLFPEGLK